MIMNGKARGATRRMSGLVRLLAVGVCVVTDRAPMDNPSLTLTAPHPRR